MSDFIWTLFLQKKYHFKIAFFCAFPFKTKHKAK